MFAPFAGIPDLVEVLEQQNKSYERCDEPADTDKPPCPPQWLAALEEPNGRLGKLLDVELAVGRIWVRVDGCIGWFVVPDTLAQCLRGVQEADAENETHEEAANVGEVVQAGKQAEDKGDGDVEEQEEEIFNGRTARGPVVEEIK